MSAKSFSEIIKLFDISNNENPSNLAGFSFNQCYRGNCIEFANHFPNDCVDLIVADPPFAIDHGDQFKANYNRSGENVLEGYNEIAVKDYLSFSHQWINQAYRILKKNGTLCIVSGWSNQKDILIALEEAGFYIKSQIIFKYNFGVFTKRNFVSSHYNLFFCTKHKTKFTFNKLLWYPEDVFSSEDWLVDTWEIPREYWSGEFKTPNKLPKELVELIIGFLSKNGDIIMDFFSGSGTTLKVASYMGRNCIAVDIVPKYVEFANHRLMNLNY